MGRLVDTCPLAHSTSPVHVTRMTHAQLVTRHSRCYSVHCILDEDGWYGTATVYYGRVVLAAWRRWGQASRVTHTLWADELWQCGGLSQWRSHVAEFVKRVPKSPEGAAGERAVDADLASRYPALHEHLTLDWLEGSIRQTSTLTLFVDGGRWKGSLSDRDNRLVLFVSGDGFDAVLGAMERAIRDGTGDWREQRDWKAKSKRG